MNLKLILKSEFMKSFFCQVVATVSLLVQNKFFAILFSTAEYGKWSLILAAFTFIQMLPFSAIDNAIARNIYAYKDSIKIFNKIIIYIYMILFCIYFIVIKILNTFLKIEFVFEFVEIYFFSYVMTEILKTTGYVVSNALRERQKVLKMRVFELLSTILILAILAFSKKTDLISTMLLFFSIKNTIMIFIMYEKSKVVIEYVFFKEVLRKIITYAYPFIIWNFFNWIQNTINKWYINDLLNETTVALYTALVGISIYIPNFYLGIANNYLLPIIFSKKEGLKLKQYIKSIGVFSIPLIFYCSMIPFIGKYLVVLLYDTKYVSVVPYLPITSMIASLNVIASFSTFDLYHANQTKKMIFPQIMPGIVMSILGRKLIVKYGFQGAVINHVMGQLVFSVLTFFVCICFRIRSDKNIGKRE